MVVTAAKPPGARARQKVKKASSFEAELEGYKKLFKGDIKGFWKNAWADVLVLVLALGVVGLMSESWHGLFRPFFMPSHNLTLGDGPETNETNETNTTTSNTTTTTTDNDGPTVYVSGPLDLLFLGTLVTIFFVVQDLIREFGSTIFKLANVDKPNRPAFLYHFQHVLILSVFLFFNVTEIMETGLTDLALLAKGYPEEQQYMTGPTKVFIVLQVAYYIQRALGLRLADIKFKDGQEKSTMLFLLACASVAGVFYALCLTKLALVLFAFDITREIVAAVYACALLIQPRSSKDEKKMLTSSKSSKAQYEAALKMIGTVNSAVNLMMRVMVVLVTVLIVNLGCSGDGEDAWPGGYSLGGVVIGIVVVWQVGLTTLEYL